MANMYVFFLLIYIFETITVFIYCENVFEHRDDIENAKSRITVACIASFAVCYGLSFVNLPVLNVIAFMAMCLLICFSGYQVKLVKGIFSSILLTALMFFTEAITILVVEWVADITLTDPIYDPERPFGELLGYMAMIAMTKLMFFLSAFIIAKTILNKDKQQQTDKFMIVLGILPLTTVFVLSYFIYFDANFEITTPHNYSLIFCSVFLIITNVIVFLVYDYTQRLNLQITHMELEKQKEATRTAYYDMMMTEHNNQKILIHDIKRHLHIIENAATDGNCDSVTKYVDSIRDQFGMSDKIHYSGNKLIDVIVYRYVGICKEKGINIEVESGNTADDFMNDADLTALLDNMFENAVESAEKSNAKKIYFNISNQNDHFLVITMTNSCDNSPEFKNGIPVSMKKGANHGIGIKSMKKIVEKYDGSLDWIYYADSKTFECEAVLKN